MTKINRSVLITGASRGIGKAIAIELATQGFDIVLNFRQKEKEAQQVANLVENLNCNARLLKFDISDRKGTFTAINKDIEINTPYYGVICNAGVVLDNAFPAMSNKEWDDVINTNLGGFYNVIQPCVMPMIHAKNGGRIVTLSSISGLVGNRGQANYSASKAGIIGATKALAIELAKRKITVNCVAPGIIKTDMTKAIDDKYLKEIVPMRRMGNPEEVAAIVGFLLSDRASYITRQVISVNGGMIG